MALNMLGELLRIPKRAVAVGFAIILAACAQGGPIPDVTQTEPRARLDDSSAAYRLGSGDELRVIVFGEPDLSGEFQIDGSGAFSMPLVGQLDAFQLTVVELEKLIAGRLAEGYLVDPRVSIEVLNYRPFYIVGEVKSGGEFPYVSGMHAVRAVALAGGYTYRANTQKVLITRKGAADEIEKPASQGTVIFPGDVIRIPERYF